MIALHPWLRALPVGAIAFWLGSPLAFNNAAFLAVLALIGSALKFSKDQQAFEQQLLRQQRQYPVDVEQTFSRIQRAMSNVWLNDSHWQLVTADLASGYMLYRYEWREEDSGLHDGRLRHHANLEIECFDDSDAEQHGTVVKLSFDGFPNCVNKRIFYDAVRTAAEMIDGCAAHQFS